MKDFLGTTAIVAGTGLANVLETGDARATQLAEKFDAEKLKTTKR